MLTSRTILKVIAINAKNGESGFHQFGGPERVQWRQHEREMDAMYGKPRADGSRLQSFGALPRLIDGKWVTVFISTYDNGDIVETVCEPTKKKPL